VVQERALARKHEKMAKSDKTAEMETEIPVNGEEKKIDGDGGEGVPGNDDPVKTLEKRLADAEAAAAQAQDRLLRILAEHENYKKRALRETADFQKFANEALMKNLLPVIDNLERAVESSAGNKDAEHAIVVGVKMTLDEIYKVLERFSLKSLETEGKPFDPNFHQAVLQQESAEHSENTVLKEMQKGYVLHDRLIRPAMVVVSKALVKTNDEGRGSENESAGQA
jgi:molecular chaperone GrpE